MGQRLVLAFVLVFCAACGRLGFDPRVGADLDAASADSASNDAVRPRDSTVPADVPPLTGDTFIWDFDDASEYVVEEGQAVIAGGLLSLGRIAQRDDEWAPAELEGGTVAGTRWSASASALELDGMNVGTFTSRIIDAGGPVDWDEIAWQPERPSGKPFPTSAESGYPVGNQSAAGLVLLSRMDALGATIEDLSGMGHMGTNSGATLEMDGVFAGAASVRVGQWIGYGSPPTATVTGDLTVSVWVRRYVVGSGFHFMISKESMPVGAGWCLFFDSMDRIYFCTGEVPILNTVTSTRFTSTTRWYHVAAVHRRGSQRIFVDGVVQPLASGGSHAIDLGTNSHDLEIGRRYSDDMWLEGAVDDVAVLSRALSDTEIREVFLRGATRIRYRVRACGVADCSDAPFVGPDGDPSTWYSELDNLTGGTPRLTASAPLRGRYFQYRAELERIGTTESPRFSAVEIGPPHFHAGRTVVGATATVAFSMLTGFRQTTGGTHGGELRYQLSLGDGRWWYASGGSWSEATAAGQESTIAELDVAASTFHDVVGSGDLSIRIVASSPLGVPEVALDAVTVGIMR